MHAVADVRGCKVAGSVRADEAGLHRVGDGHGTADQHAVAQVGRDDILKPQGNSKGRDHTHGVVIVVARPANPVAGHVVHPDAQATVDQDVTRLDHVTALGPQHDAVAAEIRHHQTTHRAVASGDDVDYVMAAIVGAAGLQPTLAAARAGKRVLLANKEALVMSGKIFMQTVKEHNAELLPIDSEHNAIFQCMPGNLANSFSESGLKNSGIRKILLTASGGPFRETPLQELKTVTPQQACAHPKWKMGPKISVDSATMMNKGLEVIEAHWFFQVPPERIEIVIHPQGIVHSMVEYVDSSIIAQLSVPDMRIPIAYALSYPKRLTTNLPGLNLAELNHLTFDPPDFEKFPALKLAYEALERGGTLPAVLNAANEVAVEAFLQGTIGFDHIPQVIASTMNGHNTTPLRGVEDVLAADQWAKEKALDYIREVAR